MTEVLIHLVLGVFLSWDSVEFDHSRGNVTTVK